MHIPTNTFPDHLTQASLYLEAEVKMLNSKIVAQGGKPVPVPQFKYGKPLSVHVGQLYRALAEVGDAMSARP